MSPVLINLKKKNIIKKATQTQHLCHMPCIYMSELEKHPLQQLLAYNV